jgi:hypothetical protein
MPQDAETGLADTDVVRDSVRVDPAILMGLMDRTVLADHRPMGRGLEDPEVLDSEGLAGPGDLAGRWVWDARLRRRRPRISRVS